jgi:diguanylate cyclase (GGDEF)-like protein
VSCPEIVPWHCLCGRAVATGEVVVSGNAVQDGYHAHCHLDTDPHGRVVIPLKAVDRVVGLLVFHTPPGTQVGPELLKLFRSLGSQIGIALNNAALFQQIRSSSLHDPLTGLANRRFLEIELGRSFEEAKRYEQPLSILMLDIDHFKAFNDRHGHLQGDRLLAEIAELLVKEMREADFVFRYGGEEFLVMLPETDPDKAHEAAERLRCLVQAETEVTVSVGLSCFKPGMRDMYELIAQADTALYRAKALGRNRVETAPVKVPAKGEGRSCVLSAAKDMLSPLP